MRAGRRQGRGQPGAPRGLRVAVTIDASASHLDRLRPMFHDRTDDVKKLLEDAEAEGVDQVLAVVELLARVAARNKQEAFTEVTAQLIEQGFDAELTGLDPPRPRT